MGWAEIVKGVNSNLNKTLDVLINEKNISLENSITSKIDVLDQKNDVIMEASVARKSVAGDVIKHSRALGRVELPDFLGLGTFYPMYDGVYRFKLTVDARADLAFNSMLLKIQIMGGPYVYYVRKPITAHGLSVLVHDVFLLRGKGYDISAIEPDGRTFILTKLDICYDIVKGYQDAMLF